MAPNQPSDIFHAGAGQHHSAGQSETPGRSRAVELGIGDELIARGNHAPPFPCTLNLTLELNITLPLIVALTLTLTQLLTLEEDRQSLDRLMSVEAPESESSSPLTEREEVMGRMVGDEMEMEMQMEAEADAGPEAQQRELNEE